MSTKHFLTIVFLLAVSYFLSPCFWKGSGGEASAQNHSVVLDGAYIVLDGGTAATNVYMVVDQSSILGIIRPGGGHISSEGQYNYVKWNSGTATGTYVFPFGVGGTAADYIPFTFNKTTAGNSNISMSTWTTNQANLPYPGVSNVAAVTSMTGTADPVNNAIDRFWDIQSSAAVTAALTFSYRGSENTTLVPTDPFMAQHWNGAAWDPQVGPSSPGVAAGIGAVGPIPGQTTFSPWVLTRVSALTATITGSQNPLCYNQCTGTATVTPVSGSTPYSYSWNTTPPQTTQTATGLCAGNYTVTVTDGSSTTTTATVTITQPAQLTSTVTPATIQCFGGVATVTVSATGGTGAYTYDWTVTNPPQTTSNANLGAGTYTSTVTDANGCPITQTVTLTEPSAITPTVTSTTPILCFGGTTTATVTANGGTGAYTYAWTVTNPPQTTSNANLGAGTYTSTVTDANGCTSTQTLTLTEPSAITPTITSTAPILCFGDTTSATVTANGGTGTYTYVWNDPQGQTTPTATGLAAGNYIVTVTDANGCTGTQTVNISQPAALSSNLSSVNAPCGTNNGTATAVPNGGTGPYNYSWSITAPTQTTPTATGLAAGNYTVTITDANGCTFTDTVNVNQDPAPIAGITGNNVICFGESATLTASGGTSYVWNTTATSPSIVVSPATQTNYSVVVTSGTCTASATMSVNVNPVPTVNAGPDVTISYGASTPLSATTGGTTYGWNPTNGLSCINCPNPVANPLATTTYVVTYTDANGCTNTDTVIVYVDATCTTLYLPNAFSPNGDGEDDEWRIYTNNLSCITDFKIVIYDRWGEKVFESTDPDFRWNGRYGSRGAEGSAVFVYRMQAELISSTKIDDKGNVSLLR